MSEMILTDLNLKCETSKIEDKDNVTAGNHRVRRSTIYLTMALVIIVIVVSTIIIMTSFWPKCSGSVECERVPGSIPGGLNRSFEPGEDLWEGFSIWVGAKTINQSNAMAEPGRNLSLKPFEEKFPPVIPYIPVIPTELRFHNVVAQAISRISIPRMTEFLTEFVAFNNRYYTSASGSDSSNFLFSEIQNIISNNSRDYKGMVSVTQYTHSWVQKSIIARIEGTNGNPKQIIVLGAHLDSATHYSYWRPTGRAPGADDNGSGTTTILEAFRVLLASGFIPKTTIEFQWYAAEEVGLLGSRDIANNYKANGVDILAMTQFDMTGYLSVKKRIAFLIDYTDPGLTAFLKKVVDEYCNYTWMDRTCGYDCSDHVSFYRAGYKVAFPTEDIFNPNMHTKQDTLAYVNFAHVHEFTKLAIGFAIEVADYHRAPPIFSLALRLQSYYLYLLIHQVGYCLCSYVFEFLIKSH